MAANALQLAKRALVAALLAFARQYALSLDVNRESSDKVVLSAYRKVARKVHPDKGGTTEDAAKLNAARDAWEQASVH